MSSVSAYQEIWGDGAGGHPQTRHFYGLSGSGKAEKSWFLRDTAVVG
ncbi:MAG: hypothetical protein F6K04_08205 [Leptolyngbya sp. SIO4C5]|nr:hypothetical protein [Leptolyngbya sp. SIO4C5]